MDISFFSSLSFKCTRKASKHQKGTMILHSKYLSQPVFFCLNNILHVHSAVSHWYVQSLASLEKYVSSGIFFSGIIFFLIIKVGHTKIFFFGSFNTMSSEWSPVRVFFFSFSLNRFAKCNSRVRGTCCRVYWRGTSISDVILQKKEKKTKDELLIS